MSALAELAEDIASIIELARKDLCAFLTGEGYYNLCCMPNRELAGVKRYLFTTAVVIGIDEWGWRTRFCFETAREAEAALAAWDGTGFPPGFWIKQKPEEITNPRLAK
jgi:hypothetical protein